MGLSRDTPFWSDFEMVESENNITAREWSDHLTSAGFDRLIQMSQGTHTSHTEFTFPKCQARPTLRCTPEQ